MTESIQRTVAAALIFALFGFSGCADTPKKTGDSAPEQSPPPSVAMQFPNVPLPKGIELDRGKTFIYESGSGNIKVGRLVFSVWNKAEDVVDYFRTEMVQNGWTPLQIVEHDTRTMLYQRKGQVCTVSVTPSHLGKTHIEIQIGPK
ncbi:hypothetical protein [Nitrospina gracilis]|uniref:hypothetical protein n=1 Tax=Nitrospina gracilis TaxID=35801 RepID=UPI001F4701E0|nr:hypothetical protein [Nitrospina gracilis]MCF8720262.1 hypothetical protein [Nitrospina gracilis Nb-211]